jgi:D-sedoheptulose 7-phosphate isomerase
MTGIEDELNAHVDAIRSTVAESAETIRQIVDRLAACFEGGGKLLICGNGGSAADAQHFAAEFVNRMRFDRRPLPAIALTTDSSVLTSIANDSAYAVMFARQVEALGQPGDVLFGFSTSGRSENVLAALRAGRDRGLYTVGFTGRSGADRMAPQSDAMLVAASDDTARIQECHEFVYHFIASAVERAVFPRDLPTNAPQQ